MPAIATFLLPPLPLIAWLFDSLIEGASGFATAR